MLSLLSLFSFLWLLSKMGPGFGHKSCISLPGAGTEDWKWLRDSCLVGSEEHLLSALRDWVPLLSPLVSWSPRWELWVPHSCWTRRPALQPNAAPITSDKLSSQHSEYARLCRCLPDFTKATEDLRPQARPCVCLPLWILKKLPQGKLVAGANPGFEIQTILEVYFKEDKKEGRERDAISRIQNQVQKLI